MRTRPRSSWTKCSARQSPDATQPVGMAANDQLIVAAILVAGGSGQRLGASVPKAFVPLGDGQPMLSSPARLLNRHRGVRDVIVVAPAGWTDAAAAIVPDAVVVVGGSHRQKSVERGLAALQPDV